MIFGRYSFTFKKDLRISDAKFQEGREKSLGNTCSFTFKTDLRISDAKFQEGGTWFWDSCSFTFKTDLRISDCSSKKIRQDRGDTSVLLYPKHKIFESQMWNSKKAEKWSRDIPDILLPKQNILESQKQILKMSVRRRSCSLTFKTDLRISNAKFRQDLGDTPVL